MRFEVETDRLRLREFVLDDAEFILALLNQPSFLRFIGDKGVRTIEEARAYISNGPIKSYLEHGFGLYLVELNTSHAPIGMCGVLKRDTLEHVDLGFAFLPEFWGKGYALEAASAVLKYARQALELGEILAITDPDNEASINLLQKLAFRFQRMTKLSDESTEVKLFAQSPEAP